MILLSCLPGDILDCLPDVLFLEQGDELSGSYDLRFRFLCCVCHLGLLAIGAVIIMHFFLYLSIVYMLRAK